MKLRHLPSLCAALLALCPTLATAQSTSAVPGLISYQGRVVDAAGANVGAGTPVNRTVIFRIWDNPSSTAAANLIYSESQIVTVSEGEFSVLVGQGVENPTQTFSYSESAKKLADFGTAFNGSARYLGVTVAAGATIVTTDNEITPRQQIVSTAFAMRAKFAESIGSSTDLTLTPLSGTASTASNYGLGWYGTGRLFGTTAVDGPVLYGNSGGGLGSNNGSTKTLALQWNAFGQIGVGATTFDTNNKLTLQGDDSATPARQLVIRGNTDTSKRLNIGFDTTGNQATLQSYTAASTAGNLLLNPSGGNVGIGTGTAAPTAKLDVAGDIKSNGKPVPVGEESLRIIRGSVTGAGVIVDGTGFTAAIQDAILVKVTFNAGTFSSAPSVVVSPLDTNDGWTQYVTGISSTLFYSGAALSGTGYRRQNFTFIAIGPR